jgi:hypothetical protein
MNKSHFIIAGERRSGSSTLYELLKQHPEIGMLEKSDYDYFIEPELFSNKPIGNLKIQDWNLNHSKKEYLNFFEHLQGKSKGYKDADLLWWKSSHARVAEFIPDAKYIFILRNPVKRAESQFFNELRKGRENLTFNEAIEREENNTLSNWQQLHLQYLERGKYAESLEHFYKHVSKNQVKVLILEELFDNFDEVLADVCEFLEIDVTHIKDVKPLHTNKEEVYVRKSFSNNLAVKWIFDIWERGTEGIIVRLTINKDKRRFYRKKLRGFYKESARKKMAVSIDTTKKLYTYYKPFNKKLEQLLGKEIKYWNHD